MRRDASGPFKLRAPTPSNFHNTDTKRPKQDLDVLLYWPSIAQLYAQDVLCIRCIAGVIHTRLDICPGMHLTWRCHCDATAKRRRRDILTLQGNWAYTKQVTAVGAS
jgi:hypothetical protein